MFHAVAAWPSCPSSNTWTASFLSACKNWWLQVLGTQYTAQQRSQRLQAVLEDWCLIGLEHRPLMALSGGELQRALLARMSLAEAPVLLLDEPHAALDEDGQALCWKHIHAWHSEGRTLVIVCHDLASVRHHTQHVLQIKNTGCLFGPSKALIRPQPQMQVA